MKYTPAGGDIFVSLKDENEKLRLDVRDTGKGISQDEVTMISSVSSRLKGLPVVLVSVWHWSNPLWNCIMVRLGLKVR